MIPQGPSLVRREMRAGAQHLLRREYLIAVSPGRRSAPHRRGNFKEIAAVYRAAISRKFALHAEIMRSRKQQRAGSRERPGGSAHLKVKFPPWEFNDAARCARRGRACTYVRVRTSTRTYVHALHSDASAVSGALRSVRFHQSALTCK